MDRIRKTAAANATVARKAWRGSKDNAPRCSYCRPHRGENATHPERPDRYKNHRRRP